MTDARYLEWKRDIAKARADGDRDRLYSLQLDYNLELGECLAHQSQRTKDIMGEVTSVKTSLSNVTEAVSGMDVRMENLETAVVRTADNVSALAKSVQDLISYRDGIEMKGEGVRIAGKTLRSVILGAATVIAWVYAIYMAISSHYGN